MLTDASTLALASETVDLVYRSRHSSTSPIRTASSTKPGEC